MYISLDWLKDFIDIENIKPEDVATALTLKSAEVEATEYSGKHLEQVKLARIDKIEDHPNSDHLHLVTIFDGESTPTIVCGAQNIAVGQIVPYAPLGTVLPGNFEIKPAKIRGVESCGMLCSGKELGLGEDHSGIFQFDKNLQPGKYLAEFFGKSDFIIEIENKTINNRPDLWGHYGIARELHTILSVPWKKRLLPEDIKIDNENENFKIELKSDKAIYYLGFKMSGLTVEESPDWMKKRLINTGLRPINKIVDATNYIMMETGQPMHAFDRREIIGNTIIVKEAEENEEFTTLDEEKHKLSKEDLLIADNTKTLALAGVMGGLNSQIKEDTTEIFAEFALFDASTIRKTSNRLDLRTDSSSRFEKSLWPENCHTAAHRFVEIIKKLFPNAEVTSNIAVGDRSENYGFKGKIITTPERIRKLLGITEIDLPNENIEKILKSLEFTIENDGETYKITVPAHRASKDISIEADIIEEVGRIYGFNNIKSTKPLFPMNPAPRNTGKIKEDRLKALFCDRFSGHEIITYSFITEKDIDTLQEKEENLIKVQNSGEKRWLRTSLLPGMLEKVKENLKNYKDFRLFESGKVFPVKGEERHLAMIISGGENLFQTMKEIASSIITTLGVPNWRTSRPSSNDPFYASTVMHPGRSAIVTSIKSKIAVMGEIHPEIISKSGIKERLGYIEINLDKLFDLPSVNTKFKPLYKFPSTFFEFTLVIDEKEEVAPIFNAIKKSINKKTFVSSEIVSFFSGSPIPEGKKSVSFRVILNGVERTLESDEIKNIQDKLISDIRKKGYKLKGDD